MTRLGVKGAVVGGEYIAGDVSISNGLIDQVGLPPGSGGLAIPGFVDLQVMGFGGVDFTTASAQEWRDAESQLASTGVTSYLANIISNDFTVVERALEVAEQVSSQDQSSRALLKGVHLEGPFLSQEKAGIHSKDFLRSPDLKVAQNWIDSGSVTFMTVAPELPGAIDLIASLTEQGVVVSLGHSNGTAEEAGAGFDAGATAVTHIFNAMSGITARQPGLAGMAILRESVWIQLILDLLHVDRVLAQLLIKILPNRIVLVTDCLPVTGTSTSRFNLSGTEVELVDGIAVSQTGVLAGSVLTMDQALRNAVDCGMDEIAAINATSLNPLRLLKKVQQTLIEPGSPADMVIVSDSFQIEAVLCRGNEVNQRRVQ